MPHLVLRLERDGPLMSLVMVEVGKGEVTEIQARVDDEYHRKPTHAEMLEAGKILGGKKDVDVALAVQQWDKVQRHKEQLERRIDELKVDRKFKDERIAELEKHISALKKRQITDDAMAIVATALEIRIEELAMTGDLNGYARVKEIYEQLTGRSWVDEDE